METYTKTQFVTACYNRLKLFLEREFKKIGKEDDTNFLERMTKAFGKNERWAYFKDLQKSLQLDGCTIELAVKSALKTAVEIYEEDITSIEDHNKHLRKQLTMAQQEIERLNRKGSTGLDLERCNERQVRIIKRKDDEIRHLSKEVESMRKKNKFRKGKNKDRKSIKKSDDDHQADQVVDVEIDNNIQIGPNFSSKPQDILFYDFPAKWSDGKIRQVLTEKFGILKRLRVKRQYKYKSVRALIHLTESKEAEFDFHGNWATSCDDEVFLVRWYPGYLDTTTRKSRDHYQAIKKYEGTSHEDCQKLMTKYNPYFVKIIKSADKKYQEIVLYFKNRKDLYEALEESKKEESREEFQLRINDFRAKVRSKRTDEINPKRSLAGYRQNRATKSNAIPLGRNEKIFGVLPASNEKAETVPLPTPAASKIDFSKPAPLKEKDTSLTQDPIKEGSKELSVKIASNKNPYSFNFGGLKSGFLSEGSSTTKGSKSKKEKEKVKEDEDSWTDEDVCKVLGKFRDDFKRRITEENKEDFVQGLWSENSDDDIVKTVRKYREVSKASQKGVKRDLSDTEKQEGRYQKFLIGDKKEYEDGKGL